MAEQTFEFRLKKIFAQQARALGLSINLDRYQVRRLEDDMGRMIAQGILLLAIKEDEVFEYPVNFLTKLGQKWQNLKAKMPRRMRKWFPLEHARVWAVSKFPDVNVPADYFGSEHVHFRVINEKELEVADE